MRPDPFIRRTRNWYTKLLRLYPKAHRERFGEGMEQTFNDLCRERRKAGEGLFTFALWAFAETFAGITKESTTMLLAQTRNIVSIAALVALMLLATFSTRLGKDLLESAKRSEADLPAVPQEQRA